MSFDMEGEGKMFYFGSTQPSTKEAKPTRQRKRSPDKMQRNRDLTAARRQEENSMIAEFTDVLPLSKEELKKADRTALIRLALHFIKMKTIPGLSQSSVGDARTISCALTSSINVPGFSGFVLLVDEDLNIMYSSDNITKQLGPLLVDTIGQQLDELIHPDDYPTARDSLMSVFSEEQGSNKKVNFVAGMKTTLSTSIRSATKIQYKNVFVTCYLKTFGHKGELPWASGTTKSLAVLLCRSEDIKGMPEICFGAYVESYTDMQCRFLRIDIRGEWIFGYGAKSLLGKDAKVLRHPGDELDTSLLVKRKELIFCKGSFVSPAYRIVTAWGDWLWVKSSFEPRIGPKGEWKGFKVRTWIVGTGEVVTAALQSAIASKAITSPRAPPQPRSSPSPQQTSSQSCQKTVQQPPQAPTDGQKTAVHLQYQRPAQPQSVPLQPIPQPCQRMVSTPSQLSTQIQTGRLHSSTTSSGYSSPEYLPHPCVSPPFERSNIFSYGSTSYSSPRGSDSPTSTSASANNQTLTDDAIEDFLRDIMGETNDKQTDYSNHTSPQSTILNVFSPESTTSFSDHSNHSDSHSFQPQHSVLSPQSTVSSVSGNSQPLPVYQVQPNSSTDCTPSPETPFSVDFFSTQRDDAYCKSFSLQNGYLSSNIFNPNVSAVNHSQLLSTRIAEQSAVNASFKPLSKDMTRACSIQRNVLTGYQDFSKWTDNQHPIVL